MAAGAACANNALGQPYRVGESAASRARHHPVSVDACRNDRIEQLDLLLDRKRVPFAVGSEDRETAVLGEQPFAVRDKPHNIRVETFIKWGDYRRQHAAYALKFCH